MSARLIRVHCSLTDTYLLSDYDPRQQATKKCARQQSVCQSCILPHSRLMATRDLAKAIDSNRRLTNRVSTRAISIVTVMWAPRETVNEEIKVTAPSMVTSRNLERSSIRATKQISCHHSQVDLKVEQ